MNITDLNQITIKDYIPKKLSLENNIPVYCFNNNDMEVVFVSFVFFNAGTISQNKFFTASLTKTQLSQQTKDYSDKQLSELLDYYGINYGQSTSSERTTLTFSFLKQFQNQAVKLLEQIVLYPVFSQSQLDITISKCKQDFLTKCSQGSFLAHRDFMYNLFGENSPYGKYAQFEDYDKVNSKDLEDFYHKYYSYNQCYIILSGNVDNDLIAQMNSIFGLAAWNGEYSKHTHNTSLTPSSTDNGYTFSMDYSDNQREKINIVNLPSAVQSSICMGKFLPFIKHKDYIPLTFLNCLFGGYFNSRLMSSIREEKGFTYGIDSFIAPYKKGSVLMIVCEVNKENDFDTIEEIKHQIIRLQTEDVSKQELDMVKHYMIGELLRSTDGVIDISQMYDSFVRFNLPDDYNSKSMKILKALTSEDVKFLANKYLNKDSFTISIAKNND